jgi:maltooligosyltrehalose trehalohydrolase
MPAIGSRQPAAPAVTRRFPAGAEVQPGGGAHFRVWAPRRKKVEVVFDSGESAQLEREADGYYSGFVAAAADGMRYRYRLDGGNAFPDPVSRFQPEGPHGPSQIVDPSRFHWTDAEWRGVGLEGQVIYEMHVGTFTREGTWEAARREIPELAGAGITVLEIMPVADFPGEFGWGYDGVQWFAPVAIYGQPDDFRRFVDDAHRAGLGVILDTVYNHLGPDGCYLKEFSEDYFTTKYANEWGEPINYDGENSGPVRELVTSNTAYWATEYHIDGLRLDATQQIFDSSPVHILAAAATSMRKAAGKRKVFIVAENENQDTSLARTPQEGGCALDGLWNDDFHHAAHVAVTGRNEAYYTDYLGKPQELISAVKYGYLFQGQRYKWQSKRRGLPALDIEPWRFVTYIQNHDQIANSGRGERLHQITSPGRYKAITALLLLTPGTPMLFQGQEFAASSPFLFFAAHNGALREKVREGRIQFLAQFPSLAQPEMYRRHIDPGDRATFERCKLDLSEREKNAAYYQMHKDLLRLRREDPVLSVRPLRLDGAVLANEAFLLRFFGTNRDDRLLLINLGLDARLDPAPEPLLAPPDQRLWQMIWSSEDPAYGGSGTAPLDSGDNWRIPGHAAVLLRAAKLEDPWRI